MSNIFGVDTRQAYLYLGRCELLNFTPAKIEDCYLFSVTLTAAFFNYKWSFDRECTYQFFFSIRQQNNTGLFEA